MRNDEFIWERMSDLDPYDQEERCRKTIRTLMKAILMRVFAGILLIAAMLRAGVEPVAIGLSVFALILIMGGIIPLAKEVRKQQSLLKASLRQQEAS